MRLDVLTFLLLVGVVTGQEFSSQDQIRKEGSISGGTVYRRRGNCTTPRLFPTHTRYHRLADIEGFMDSWADCYPDLVQKIALYNKTFENRDVYYMRIGKPDFFGNSFGRDKRAIMIEALANPREWITTAAVLVAIDLMLLAYEKNPRVTKALDEFYFVIVPVVNPDGYEYTWTKDRMWRNNRRVINATCTGVNLNRNYDVKFRTTGISETCGSPTYPGETAFSEAETQNVRNLFYDFNMRVEAFLSVHGYSKVLLYPWGYINDPNSKEVPSNVEDLKKVGKLILKDLKGYQFGRSFEVLNYGASGAAEDWALQDTESSIYAYRYGLGPHMCTSCGFKVPANRIIPTGLEFFRSVLTLSENI